MPVRDAPLLGVAGSWGATEIELHRRFDDLHQLIYRRGGLASTNAAVDEVAKLLLVRLWAARHADRSDLRENSESAPRSGILTDHRTAFAAALRDPGLMARDPAGGLHPVWPVDEPFRLTNPDVLAGADALAAAIVADALHPDAPAARPAFDALGTAFDALLAGRYDHTGGLGTYLTPSGVARMMADIALPLVTASLPDPHGPSPGFGDPYCGTGRFLVALLAALPSDHPLRSAGPFGADVSASAVAKARVNLLLYGVPNPLVWTVQDSVTDGALDSLTGRVPLMLTNPPFGEGQYDSRDGIARTAAVFPMIDRRNRLDPSIAGLARCLTLLCPGGVLGIVLPDGVLASPVVQTLLTDTGEIEPLAVVSLPPVTFALSGTVARTSALFLRRSGSPRPRVSKDALLTPSAQEGVLADTSDTSGRERVVLARVGHVGYVTRAGRPAPDPAGDELPVMARLVLDATDASADQDALAVVSESPLVAVVDRETLRTLDPSRLDPTAVAARRSLLDAGGVRLAEYLTALAPRRCRDVTSPFVSVLHVDDLGAVDWHAAWSHTPVTPGVLAEPGELIVSLLNPAQLRAAVLPPGEAVQVSAEFGVFQSTVDPYAVLALLYSAPVRAQLRPLGTGTSTSRRRIGPDDVLALVVPKLDPSALDDLAATVRSAHQQLMAARTALRAAYDRHAGLA